MTGVHDRPPSRPRTIESGRVRVDIGSAIIAVRDHPMGSRPMGKGEGREREREGRRRRLSAGWLLPRRLPVRPDRRGRRVRSSCRGDGSGLAISRVVRTASTTRLRSANLSRRTAARHYAARDGRSRCRRRRALSRRAARSAPRSGLPCTPPRTRSVGVASTNAGVTSPTR